LQRRFYVLSEQELLENQLIDRTIEQRNQILENAKNRATQILESAKTEGQKLMDQTNKNIEGIINSELRGVRDRIVGRAKLEGRKELMDARMEILEKVYNKALEKLKKIASGKDKQVDYPAVLLKLIKESDEAIAGDGYILSSNDKDYETLKQMLENIKNNLGKEVRLDEKSKDIIGGVVVTNLDGTKTLENTLENRLNSANNKLQSEIANKLGII
jgi:V/A-type H+-transporting ATPase subunit E